VFGFGQSSPENTSGRPGVQTLTLRGLTTPESPGSLTTPRVLDHHLLLLVTAGHGTFGVDFVAYPCRPGTLLWVRPGQLVSGEPHPGLDAIGVCWEADALPSLAVGTADADSLDGHETTGTTYRQLVGEDEDAVINEVSQLVVDCERHQAGDLPAELLRHQLAVLVLRVVALTHEPRDDRDDGIFRRFRHEVERSYAQSRRVEDYAARLGCSVRTLTRASLAATGRSAKQVLDDRVALEAKRLLAGTDLPVATIGQRLGFPEPTNFGRFFHREVGRSPGAFRSGPHLHPQPRIPVQRGTSGAGHPLARPDPTEAP
jgi:AraC-like DNA-binding protein